MEQLTSVSGYLDGNDSEDSKKSPSRRDGGSLSSGSSSGDDDTCPPSLFPSTHSVWHWCLDCKKLVWTERPKGALFWINMISFVGVLLSDIIIFEASTSSVRSRRHRTAIFPIYVSHSAALAFACKWKGSAGLPNFAGFFAGQMYVLARNGSDLLDIKVLYLCFISFIDMLEVQIGADILRRKLCRNVVKALPTIDTVHEAVLYFIIVFGVSLCFETLAVIVECTTGLIEWSSFARLWSTRWLAVLASFLTIAPGLIHLFAYGPHHSKLFRARKVVECLLLIVGTIVTLGLVIFSVPFTTVIRPLPYLLYPLIIFSVFRFNRLGWTLVVAVIAFFGSWGSLHYKSSALYYTSGSSARSSPMLIIQLELYMSVLGVVAISLAGAVREKKELTRDLHSLNQRLEDAVSKRTQELIKANKELQISQTHAEKANLAKSDFLANMSHEIRTPIHGILGLTALLLQTELSADQLENLMSVKDCADLLLHIINSILDLAKIEAGRLEVETLPFSIRKVVSGTLRMLQVRAKERGLQLLWKVDADVPHVIAGDPGKLQQCLLNLVGNALKFTHDGSVRVHISLRTGFESSFSHVLSVRKDSLRKSPRKSPCFPSRLRSWASWPSSDVKADLDEDNATSNVIDMFDIQMTENNRSSNGSSNGARIAARDLERQNAEIPEVGQREYVLIEVRDTGIGISKENVRDMFNPFTQADASTSRLYGGTGLGLSIVQRFVELLGGKIWVESEIGKGSMFSFVVPFHRVKEDLNSMKTGGNPQSSGVVFQPQLTSADKPPRVQRKTSLQRSSLGKGRRAHSLSTIMKNLKFTSPQFSDVEPLLQMTVVNSSDSDLKQLPPTTSKKDDRREGNIINESLEGPEKPGASRKTENLTGISQREFSEPRKLSNIEKEHPSRSSSADPEGAQLQTAVNGHSVSLGEDLSLQPSRTDPSLLSNSVAEHVVESSSSTSAGMTKARGNYRDLEMGIPDTSPVLEIMDTSNKGKIISNPNDPLPRVVSLSNLQPTLNESLDAVGNLPSQGQRSQALLPRKEKLHVLLAEDNMINQRVATRQLQKHGHIVTIVGDGLQALNAVQLNHDTYDLVLMDIQMPMMDGLQATERIRAEEAKHGWSRIPILGLTAHAISGYQETCLKHGMDAYLGKPFDIKQLLAIIQQFI